MILPYLGTKNTYANNMSVWTIIVFHFNDVLRGKRELLCFCLFKIIIDKVFVNRCTRYSSFFIICCYILHCALKHDFYLNFHFVCKDDKQFVKMMEFSLMFLLIWIPLSYEEG